MCRLSAVGTRRAVSPSSAIRANWDSVGLQPGQITRADALTICRQYAAREQITVIWMWLSLPVRAEVRTHMRFPSDTEFRDSVLCLAAARPRMKMAWAAGVFRAASVSERVGYKRPLPVGRGSDRRYFRDRTVSLQTSKDRTQGR